MTKKNLTLGLLCAFALAGLFTITKSPAQGNSPQSEPEVVLLRFAEVAGGDIKVYVSSSSAGAPKFPSYPQPMMSAGQVVADLMKLGYEVQQQDALSAIAIKRR